MNIRNRIKLVLSNTLNESEKYDILMKYDFKRFCNHEKESEKLLYSNARLKNKFSGKRCFILGNGPSLKDADLKWLFDEIVITVHQAAKSNFFGDVKSNFHFWADPDFCSNEIDNELFRCMTDSRFKLNDTECFFPIQFKQFTLDKELDKYISTNYYFPNMQLFEGFDKEIDFTKYIPACSTVVHYAILFAIYMGCTEIVLLGCECSIIVSDIDYYLKGESEGNYAYKSSQEEIKRKQKIRAKHLMEDTFKGNYHVFRGYRILKEYCAKEKISIWNATPGGLLDCVPRKNIEDFKTK